MPFLLGFLHKKLFFKKVKSLVKKMQKNPREMFHAEQTRGPERLSKWQLFSIGWARYLKEIIVIAVDGVDYIQRISLV